jgi:hypothetical protein
MEVKVSGIFKAIIPVKNVLRLIERHFPERKEGQSIKEVCSVL